MDSLNILSAMEIGVPLPMVVSYIAITSLCLFLSRVQLGLAVSFLSVFYIGYLYNRDILIEAVKGYPMGLVVYAFLGVIIIILAIISFLSSRK